MAWSRRKIIGICSVDGCGKELKAKGLCAAHYQMKRKHGRLHRIINTYKGINCCEDGCIKPVEAFGYCHYHYKIARRTGKLHKDRYKRDHPLYNLWHIKRKTGLFVPEWNEFTRFVDDIGERPGKNYTFVRPKDEPFGPNNFEWRENLYRFPGETKKAWYARKWQSRKMAYPGWDNDRRLKKIYGLTREKYKEMLAAQAGVCAVCKGPEKKFDTKSGVLRSLAVDHCHETGKVRGLLCSRCNMMIGQIEESDNLLRSMMAYIIEHRA